MLSFFVQLFQRKYLCVEGRFLHNEILVVSEVSKALPSHIKYRFTKG